MQERRNSMTRDEARLTLQDNFGYLTNEHPRIVEALRVALEVLDEDTLPSNIDEAAAKYIESQTPADQGEEMIIYKAFKAGAEWQDSQYADLVRYCQGALWHWGIENNTPFSGLEEILQKLGKL